MDDEIKKHVLKTGTSLVGIVCKDGIVMAGDKKVTAGGSLVVNKNFKKVRQLNDYLVMSWTGGVSDAMRLTKLVTAELKLKELKDKRRPSVKEAANLIATIAYSSIRQPSMIPFIAGTMLGGVNDDGSTALYSIEPSGSATKIEDFDANFSSGMPYILGMLEKNYKKDLSIEEGILLAADAIKTATERDTASGYGVDIFKITKEGIIHVSDQSGKWIYTEKKE